MVYRNYLPKDLRRRFDEIKIAGDEEGGYEPALVIYRDSRPGKSFIIPIGSMWKYLRLDEYNNPEDAQRVDREDFEGEKDKWLTRKNRMAFMPPRALEHEKRLLASDWVAILAAEGVAGQTGMMLCCALNIMRLMQMMDLWGVKGEDGRVAFQLFEFIRDGLDELKNHPGFEDTKTVAYAGEMELFIGGAKVGGKDITLTETELIEEGN